MASTTGVLVWLIVLTCSCYAGQPSKHYDCLEDRSLDQLCVNPNSTSKVGCSRRGDCICGVCECHARRQHGAKYSGRFCHCDDYICSHHMNQLCGGHGRCECGRCMCDEGYTGEACECPLSPDTCMTSKGVICNGFGDCECGVCKCNGSSWKGPTCEECPTCPGPCSENKDCVLCQAFGTGPFDAERCEEMCTQRIDIVNELNEMENDVYLCQFDDPDDDCRFWFAYEYGLYWQLRIRVLKDKKCPGAAAVNRRPTVTLLLAGLAVFILRHRDE